MSQTTFPSRGHECQICERALTAKKGLLSKHGYKRPGDGFLHGECFGAHRAAFPATDALAEYRGLIAQMLGDAFHALSRLDAEAPRFHHLESVYAPERAKAQGVRGPYLKELVEYVPGVSAEYPYERALDSERWSARGAVRRLVGELARVDARIARAEALRAA